MAFPTKRKFRTAGQLHITAEQRYALITTLVLLENGEMHHVPAKEGRARSAVPAGKLGFDMSTWRCGSVACIGGTAERVSAVTFRDDQHPALYDLFYMNRFPGAMDSVTPRQAAKALRNYLETGKARWADVLTKRQKAMA